MDLATEMQYIPLFSAKHSRRRQAVWQIGVYSRSRAQVGGRVGWPMSCHHTGLVGNYDDRIHDALIFHITITNETGNTGFNMGLLDEIVSIRPCAGEQASVNFSRYNTVGTVTCWTRDDTPNCCKSYYFYWNRENYIQRERL